MTVSQSLKEWLLANEKIDFVDGISTELLMNSGFSLSKTPQNQVTTFIDGSQVRTEYYMFFARQSTQLEKERVSNDEFLEQLEDWIYQKNKAHDLPILDNGRICQSVGVSSTFYLYQMKENESVYSLTIEIVYRKEK